MVIVCCWSLDVFSRRVFASAEIQPLHFSLVPAGLRVEPLWSTAARIELSCTVLYIIVWFLVFLLKQDRPVSSQNVVKSCSKTANLPSNVSVDGCVAPVFDPLHPASKGHIMQHPNLKGWTSCRIKKRWIQTLHFCIPKSCLLQNTIKTTIYTPTVVILSLKELSFPFHLGVFELSSAVHGSPSCSSLRLMACL